MATRLSNMDINTGAMLDSELLDVEAQFVDVATHFLGGGEVRSRKDAGKLNMATRSASERQQGSSERQHGPRGGPPRAQHGLECID
ncbi:hypothetical protein PQX77_010925 [Marasmius sp. AFHP31]|nr:hypothetical protein PQX77_010925 [Marasmius sp. AFHP31]